jgi:hypothetical protein
MLAHVMRSASLWQANPAPHLSVHRIPFVLGQDPQRTIGKARSLEMDRPKSAAIIRVIAPIRSPSNVIDQWVDHATRNEARSPLFLFLGFFL